MEACAVSVTVWNAVAVTGMVSVAFSVKVVPDTVNATTLVSTTVLVASPPSETVVVLVSETVFMTVSGTVMVVACAVTVLIKVSICSSVTAWVAVRVMSWVLVRVE